MPTVKILEHGQVTIPKKFRDIFGIKAGDMADVDIEGDRIVFIPKKNRKEKALEKFEALLDSVHQRNKDKGITEAEVTRDVMQAVEEVRQEEAEVETKGYLQTIPTITHNKNG